MGSSSRVGGGRKPRAVSGFDRHIATRIRIMRSEVGVDQKELAKRLGISPQQVYKYEGGYDRVTAGRLFEISQILGIPVSRFFEGLGACTENT